MDIKDLWDKEKVVIDNCIANIKYDSVLVDTLETFKFNMEDALVKEYNLIEEMDVIRQTLEGKRYVSEILSKAEEKEKNLIKQLLISLNILDTGFVYSRYPYKEDTIEYNKNKPKDRLPNTDESKKKYETLYNKIETTDLKNRKYF